AGEEVATFPPMVAAFRICGEPTVRAASRRATEPHSRSSIVVNVTPAPRVTVPSTDTARSSSTRSIAITASGRLRPKLISTIRSVPPLMSSADGRSDRSVSALSNRRAISTFTWSATIGAGGPARRPPACALWDRDRRDDLLLVVVRVRTGVVRRHERDEGGGPRGIEAEVVAEERPEARGAPGVRRVELRIERVRAEADVVPDGPERGPVELDARVHAVVRRAVRRRRRVARVRLIEPDAGGDRLGRAHRRTGQPAVVERDSDGAVRRGRDARLE